MRLWGVGVAAIGLAAGMLHSAQPAEPEVVLLGGDALGMLAPCGCTEPMSGGIRRRATAIRQLWAQGRTTFLENGGLVAHPGRQSELKAETLAQTLGALGVSAINLGASDAALGSGELLAIDRLSGHKVISGSLSPSPTNPIARQIEHGPFLIGGVTFEGRRVGSILRETPVEVGAAVTDLIDRAAASRLAPILMLQGNRLQAIQLARDFPALRLIEYRSAGSPPQEIEWVGDTALATPADQEKHVVRLEFSNGKFSGYSAIDLSPVYKDDAAARRFYRAYLARVGAEKLLEAVPRRATERFAGTRVCGNCHEQASLVWKGSKHAHALGDLEKEGHDRDPDCVGCHVVGLESKYGYLSRRSTPKFANVGCESCHGPGLRHALDPKRVRLGLAGEKSCSPCHDLEHSPGFNFATFWPRIRHK